MSISLPVSSLKRCLSAQYAVDFPRDHNRSRLFLKTLEVDALVKTETGQGLLTSRPRESSFRHPEDSQVKRAHMLVAWVPWVVPGMLVCIIGV